MNTCDTEQIISEILDIEWAMFQHVHSERPASCQRMPEKFRKIRGGLFAVWSDETLTSYLSDLKSGLSQGRNFLMEKYARMDNRIPPLKTDPVIKEKIAEIVEIETRWHLVIRKEFPVLFRKMGRGTDPTGDGRNFSVYLACELETYGDNTIELYYRNVKKAKENNQNLALKSLDMLLQKEGFRNIIHAEKHLSKDDI